MLADAVVTASPIEGGVVMAVRTEPFETISPAESSATIDRHGMFGIVLLGLRVSDTRE
jgi:hypothetical protein